MGTKILVVDDDKVTFDLTKLKSNNFTSEDRYKKVLEGYLYTIKVLNAKKVMENDNVALDNKRDSCGKILEDIDSGNYDKYSNIFDQYSVQVVGSLDMDSMTR